MKTQLSPQETQTRVDMLASYDLVTLQALSKKQLVSLASGVVRNMSAKNKTEIIDEIILITQESRDRAASAPEGRRAVVDDPIDVRTQKLWAELTYAAESCNTDQALDSLATRLYSQIWVHETRFYKPATIKNHFTHVNKVFRQQVALSQSVRVQKVTLRFLAFFKAGLGEFVKDINKQTSSVVSAKNVSLTPVEIAPRLEHARYVLANLDAKPTWQEVAEALALVTGRRPAEIHSTARFVQESDGIRFYGQVKREKTRDGVKAEKEDAGILLPLLAPYANVQAGLKYLADQGKRFDTPEQAHRAVSKPMSRYFEGQNLKFKDMRKLYANICEAKFKPSSMSTNAYYSLIMGHGEGDHDTANSYQFFNITDLDLVTV